MKDEYRIFSDNLKYYMDLFRLSQITLGEKLGVSNATVSTWCLGQKMPRMDKIDKMCELFNCKRSSLLEARNASDLVQAKRIPVLGRIAAGTLTDAVENVIDYVEIPEAWRGEYFALKVRGSSMMPRITEDDILICKRQGEAESGDIVIAQAGRDEATVKKLVIMDNGISLQPFNPEFDPMFYTWEQKDTLPVEILGKVVESRHRF